MVSAFSGATSALQRHDAAPRPEGGIRPDIGLRVRGIRTHVGRARVDNQFSDWTHALGTIQANKPHKLGAADEIEMTKVR